MMVAPKKSVAGGTLNYISNALNIFGKLCFVYLHIVNIDISPIFLGDIRPINATFIKTTCPKDLDPSTLTTSPPTGTIPPIGPPSTGRIITLCITVIFPNAVEDLIITRKSSRTIYEGYLKEEKDVPVLIIDVPVRNTMMVMINSLFIE